MTQVQPRARGQWALKSVDGTTFLLKGEMLVGRELDCEIRLASSQISRFHAKLTVSRHGLYVEDLNSSNGTYVNGYRVTGRTSLKVGDTLAFDEMQFVIASVSARASATTAKPSPAPPRAQTSSPTGIQPTVKVDRPPRNSDALDAGPGLSPVPKDASYKEIDDVDAFLQFAGSGLSQAESDKSRDTGMPFGLSSRDSHLDLQGLRERASPPLVTSESVAEPKTLAPDQAPSLVEGNSFASELLAKPESTATEAHSIRPRPRREVTTQSDEDDATKFLGLNALNRYGATNEQHARGIDRGAGPRLVVQTAPIRGKLFALNSDEDVHCWSIGRGDAADICLRDKSVSREHAWITKLDAVFQLRVNDGASAILVNGRSVSEADLRHGDQLQFGAINLIFRVDAPDELSSTQPLSAWQRFLAWLHR